MDWIAAIFELTGSWLIGNKKEIGFILQFLGCIFWVITAIMTNVYGLLLVVMPAMIMNMRNFYKWKTNKIYKVI